MAQTRDICASDDIGQMSGKNRNRRKRKANQQILGVKMGGQHENFWKFEKMMKLRFLDLRVFPTVTRLTVHRRMISTNLWVKGVVLKTFGKCDHQNLMKSRWPKLETYAHRII